MGAVVGTVELKGLISIAGIVGGCFCIWLGYKLYLRNVIERGQAEGSGAGIKIVLKDYGPGVVFALFGAAIIAFCVTRSFSETTVKTQTLDPTGRTIVEETSKSVTASNKTPEPGASKTPGLVLAKTKAPPPGDKSAKVSPKGRGIPEGVPWAGANEDEPDRYMAARAAWEQQRAADAKLHDQRAAAYEQRREPAEQKVASDRAEWQRQVEEMRRQQDGRAPASDVNPPADAPSADTDQATAQPPPQ